jgi:hypothetical protein
MNGLRRFFLALYSVAFIAACGGLLALAWNSDQKLDITVRHFNVQAFIDASDSNRAVFTAMLVPFVLLGVLTLTVSFWISRGGSRGTLRLKQSDGGTVEVTARALETLLRDALNRIPEIRQASPTVRLAGGAVDSTIAVTIEPSASIANITALITQTTAQVLKEQVGVTNVRRPYVRINYDEITARPAGTGPSAPQPPAAPPPPPPVADQQQEEHGPTDD